MFFVLLFAKKPPRLLLLTSALQMPWHCPLQKERMEIPNRWGCSHARVHVQGEGKYVPRSRGCLLKSSGLPLPRETRRAKKNVGSQQLFWFLNVGVLFKKTICTLAVCCAFVFYQAVNDLFKRVNHDFLPLNKWPID